MYSNHTRTLRIQPFFQIQQTRWYVPINHGQVHWLFLTIHPQEQIICQHDSLPSFTRTDYATKLCHIFMEAQGGQWTGEHAATPGQQNSYDCGIYVLANIYQQVCQAHLDYTGYPSRDILLETLETRTLPTSLYQRGMDTVLDTTPANTWETITTPASAASRTHRKHRTSRYHQTTLETHQTPKNPRKNHKKDRECNFRSYGDPMEPKQANTFRIYSQNINGISVENIPETLTKNLDAMLDREVDVMGWSETNLEWNSYPLHLMAQRIFKKQFQGGKWMTTTSAIPFDTNLKPGGIALAINGATNSRTNVTGKDLLGRWLWATMEGKTGSVTIVQLYVPVDSKDQGLTTTYAQQYEQLQIRHPNHIPKVIPQYYQDLNKFLDTLQTPIILMGDFNETATDHNLLDLQSRHNLRDVYAHKHPHQPLNTHQMGSDRIDQFLVSAPLLPQITRVGYEPVLAGIPSDHRGMYLDISRSALSQQQVAPPRKLGADYYSHAKRYRHKLFTYFTKEKILRRVQNLERRSLDKTWTRNCTQQLQSLDQDVTNGMIQA